MPFVTIIPISPRVNGYTRFVEKYVTGRLSETIRVLGLGLQTLGL